MAAALTCTSTGVCVDNLNAFAPGYYCSSGVCRQCTSGYYSDEGNGCKRCFPGFSSIVGAGSCGLTLNLVIPGLQVTYIPFNVTKINVKLWAGGGGGDTSGLASYPPSSGGGGGFASCNITVQPNSFVYIIVAGGGHTNSDLNEANIGGDY